MFIPSGDTIDAQARNLRLLRAPGRASHAPGWGGSNGSACRLRSERRVGPAQRWKDTACRSGADQPRRCRLCSPGSAPGKHAGDGIEAQRSRWVEVVHGNGAGRIQ